MTPSDFLERHGLAENPFRGEEARCDDVFARMGGADSTADPHGVHHADFEKIAGDLRRPSSSVVFGEKGAGKTAIRLQLERRIAGFNKANPDRKVLLIPHDDLNALLDRVHERTPGKSVLESLQQVRLVDHVDAVLHAVTPRVIDAVLDRRLSPEIDLGDDPRKTLRKAEASVRHDLLLLQAVYDRAEQAPLRTRMLRRTLRVGASRGRLMAGVLAVVAPLGIAGGASLFYTYAPEDWRTPTAILALAGVIAVYLLYLLWLVWGEGFLLRRPGRRLRRQVRVIARAEASYAASLRLLPRASRDASILPMTDSDEARYAMLDRLWRVLAAFGYAGGVLVVDRVDEPTLVSGDPDKMRAVIWPMMNNKFLQQPRLGVKMLLPVELRHALFRESSAFFQEARLDKQNMIERLEWTGPMLYDLCEARLAACAKPGTAGPTLMELFEPDVSRQDVIDALDRMHQPRDAFKLLYRLLGDHCAQVTAGEERWRIPRHTLQNVVKQETERLSQLYRGVRPA
ncbi:MAG: hypothetical protein HUU18_02825 [Phycisphaerales bacterium]|nr:hypothetical protein [Phycisphaerales bacterium]